MHRLDIRAIVLGLALLVSLAASGCEHGAARRPGRVLVVGLDGASLRVIEPMLEQGRLPNLARLAAAGSHGPLRAHHPLLSPRVWTSIATGKRPAKHGVLGWVAPAEGGAKRLVYGSDRRGRAIWNIASEAGLRVGVVNWLMTYPPEIVDGVMVSDHAIPAEVQGKTFLLKTFSGGARTRPIETGGPVTFPPEWGGRALDERHTRGGLTPVGDPFASDPDLPYAPAMPMLSGFYERDEQLASIALEVEATVRPDLLLVLFQGIDRVSHFLWEGVEPRDGPGRRKFSDAQAAAARRALESYYAFSDALLGLFLARYGDDDLIVVASDHGFERGDGFRTTGNHDSPRAEHGILFVAGPGIRTGRATDVGVDDVTPLILAWLGLPIGRDMDGRVPGLLESRETKWVDTHDVDPVRRLEAGASGSEQILEDQLRELGYIE